MTVDNRSLALTSTCDASRPLCIIQSKCWSDHWLNHFLKCSFTLLKRTCVIKLTACWRGSEWGVKSRNNLHSDCAANQSWRPKYRAAGPRSVSCDVSLLSPFSYIDYTVGCFNYSPSVGKSKLLQRHTNPPPFFFSAGHSLSPKYHFPELYAHHWIKMWKFCWRGEEVGMEG